MAMFIDISKDLFEEKPLLYDKEIDLVLAQPYGPAYPETAFTREEKIAFDILVKVFKKSPDEAYDIVKLWSKPLTFVYQTFGKDYLVKWLGSKLAGKEPPAPPPPAEAGFDWTKFAMLGGGILAGIIVLGLLFKMFRE